MVNPESNDAAEKKPEQEPEKTSLLSKIKGHWIWIVLGGVIVAVLIFGYWWFFMRGRVATDDAYVKADIASISSRIQGSVIQVQVENDTPVDEGDPLIHLDPTDYHVAVDGAAASVSRIEADIRAAETNLSILDRTTAAQFQQAQSRLDQIKQDQLAREEDLKESQKKRVAAEAELTYAKKELARYEALFRQKFASQEKRDNALTNLQKAESTLEALDAQIRSLKASLGAAHQEVAQATASLDIARTDLTKVEMQRYQIESLRGQHRQALATLEQSRLDLSYTVIRAPIKGVVAQKNIQVGDHVQTGQPFMAVVPLQAVYAEANYKETKVGEIRPGQRAIIEADAYAGHTFYGRVSGVRAGTGASFSLLPPENASGNWIKVVQRVPVRIEFDRPIPAEYPLKVGLSLKVTIYTHKTVGTKTEEIPKRPVATAPSRTSP